jgi:L-fuconolactonase
MLKIDAHQHFWLYSPAEYEWIGPQMTVLQRDFWPAELRPLTEAAGIDGVVTVQARQSLAETEFLLQLAAKNEFIKGVVGWVDLRQPDVAQHLAHFAAQPKFVGVRHIVQSEPDDKFMLRPDFQRGVSLLAHFDLAYDLLIYPRHLPAAYELVQALPRQRFVLDHLAKPLIKDRLRQPWTTDIRRLAALPNVCCKVSGLVTEAHWRQWQPADFQPYLDVVFDAFGPQRLMFGSDWPVCTLAADYAAVVKVVEDYTAGLSQAERVAVWGETAAEFYGLGNRPVTDG